MKNSFLTKIRRALILTTVLLLLVSLTGGLGNAPGNNLSSLLMTAKAAEAVLKTGTATADVVVVYNAPNTESAVLGSYPKGAKVEILQEKGGWGRTVKGWVDLRYVKLDSSTAPATTTVTNGMGTVTASILNIRSEASTNGKILGTFQKGHRIEILQTTGNWGRTVSGWVSLSYVKMDDAAAPSTGNTTTTYTTGMGTVTANSLNIRNDASINAKILGTFKKGHRVEILQVAGSWGRTVSGWISLKYVKMDAAASEPSTGTNTTYTTGMGTVTAKSLNIRNDASINAKILGTFQKGHRVEILQVAGTWGRTVSGWISLNYVKMDAAASEPSTDNTNTTYTTGMGTVTASSLNIRFGAGTNYEIVGNFSKGHRVEILQVAGAWGRTVCGWVNMQYIKMDA